MLGSVGRRDDDAGWEDVYGQEETKNTFVFTTGADQTGKTSLFTDVQAKKTKRTRYVCVARHVHLDHHMISEEKSKRHTQLKQKYGARRATTENKILLNIKALETPADPWLKRHFFRAFQGCT